MSYSERFKKVEANTNQCYEVRLVGREVDKFLLQVGQEVVSL